MSKRVERAEEQNKELQKRVQQLENYRWNSNNRLRFMAFFINTIGNVWGRTSQNLVLSADKLTIHRKSILIIININFF